MGLANAADSQTYLNQATELCAHYGARNRMYLQERTRVPGMQWLPGYYTPYTIRKIYILSQYSSFLSRSGLKENSVNYDKYYKNGPFARELKVMQDNEFLLDVAASRRYDSLFKLLDFMGYNEAPKLREYLTGGEYTYDLFVFVSNKQRQENGMPPNDAAQFKKWRHNYTEDRLKNAFAMSGKALPAIDGGGEVQSFCKSFGVDVGK